VKHILYNCRIDYVIFYLIVVPDASKKLLSQLPGVKTVEVTAKYPVVEGTAKVICDPILENHPFGYVEKLN